MQASRNILQSVNGEIETLSAAAAKASSDLGVIQSSFDNAQRQTVEESQSVLPILQLQIERKGGLDQLEFIVSNEAQKNALSFRIGSGYVGSFIWKYLDELSRLPNFRYVVLHDGESGVFGFYDAAVLSAVFNPADTLVLSERYRNQISDLPSPDEVPGWNRFAELVQSAKTRELAALPSFVSGDKPVRSNWSSLKALAHMEDLGVSKLPVIDASNQIIGIIDRSRLTTRVVLEIAGDRN